MKKNKITAFLMPALISISLVSAQEKPVVAIMGFINKAPIIQTLTDHSEDGSYTEVLANAIRQDGTVDVRTPKDLDAINKLNELIQLGAVDEKDPLLQLITLPKDKFGTIMAEGADYLAFGTWSTPKNIIFEQAGINLEISLVNVETRQVITVVEAVSSERWIPSAAPMPKGLVHVDQLIASAGKEVSTVLFLTPEERDMRYQVRQINTEWAARKNGKKFLMVVGATYAPLTLLMAVLHITSVEMLLMDSVPFLAYLGLRDIYYGRDAKVRLKRLKKIYEDTYNHKI